MVEPEKITIVVVTRDRFSTTPACLDSLLRNTAHPVEILAVLGGAPSDVQADLRARYDGRVRFLFGPELLNPSESRNLGLAECRTRLAILMDNDVVVRPNWLPPLLACEKETGAAMVVPIVLDGEHRIHTAGNDLYVTYQGDKAFGCKELRYGDQAFHESSNLKRQPTGYGELHCQLVDVETARRLEVYDEALWEAGEVDSGLSWGKAGAPMWFEPASVVHYQIPTRVDRVEDIRAFAFKWDTASIAESYGHFERKWKMDIGDGGKWPFFLAAFNSKLGLLPRRFPSRGALAVDDGLYRARGLARGLRNSLYRLRDRMFGLGVWQK